MPQTIPGHADPRPAALGDLDPLLALQALCLQAARWSEADYRGVLGADGPLRCAVAESRGRVRGFVVYQPVGAETEIANLGVHPDHRRRGLGGALLAYVSREHPGDLYVEVRESNEGALGFYRALGFTSFATRANYYRDKGEAAMLLKRAAPGSGLMKEAAGTDT